MSEKLLTAEEVARYLALSERAVEELVEKGELPAYKIGGSFLRFKAENVESYRRRSNSAVTLKMGRSEPYTAAPYRFWERLEDFLYYNDFYILSLILLVLIVLAVF